MARLHNSARSFHSGDRKVRKIIECAAFAALLSSAAAFAHADVLIQSFESGGFDEAGDADVTTTPFQTTGVTNGSFSLKIQSTNTSYWDDEGHIQANPAAILSNSVLKWDVTTPTSMQIIPIFLTDTGAGYYQGTVVSVGGSANPQTMSFDYSGLGLPTDATNIRIRFQGNNGSPVSFYMDDVRVGPPPVQPGPGPSSWATNGSGNWMDASNWDPNSQPTSPPGASGSEAHLDTHGGTITTTAQITVTLTQPIGLSFLEIDKGDGGYKIAGTNPIAMSGAIQVDSGTGHVIAAPVNMSSGAQFTIAGGAALQVNNLTVNGFGSITKNGDGTLMVDKIQNCSLFAEGGTVSFLAGNGQANGFIYDLHPDNGSTIHLNGATVRTNGIYANTPPGTVDLNNGAVLTSAEYSDYAFYGPITGNGSMIVGGESTSPHVATWGGLLSYSGSTTVTNGNTLVLQSSLTTSSSLTVNTNSKVQLPSNGSFLNVIKTPSITVSDTSSIDISDNKLITGTPAGTWAGTGYTGVTGMIATGRAGATWTGPGIITSQSTAAGSNYTTLGVAKASDVLPRTATATATWAGQTITGTDTLVMYTYGGDATLDGKINVDDYIRIDSGIAAGLTGWSNGDFNYDGKVNIDDYTSFIDANIGTQGAQFATSGSFLAGGGSPGATAVPEPASLTLLTIAAAAGLHRRRGAKRTCSL